MACWLAIDPGTRRIGVAVGETSLRIASPLETVDARDRPRAVARIAAIAREYHASGIVVGWPINMDDTEGPQAEDARRLAQEIADETGLDVRLWDERLSSFTADQALAGQLTRGKRRARQDAVAAGVILEDFLEHDGPTRAPRLDERNGS